MYEIGNDSLRHHVSSFKVNLFLPRLVVCRQPPSAAVWSQINYVGQLGILFWLQPNYLVVLLSCVKFLARPPFLFRFNSFIST